MKYIFILLFIHFNSFSEAANTLTESPGEISNRVSFVVKVDIANLTKDGIYLNGYVVHIDHLRAANLNNKTIKVTGKVSIVKGLKNRPKEFDKNGKEIIKGGRYEDTKHILRPKIEIIEP